jgi:exosortase family protein XrtF
MWEKIKNNKLLLFFLKAGLLYAFWLPFYYYFLEPKTTVDERIITHIIRVSAWVLEAFGYTTFQETRDSTFQLLGIIGNNNPGVWIGTACNALTLFSLFTIFILAFPGSWKKKLWFIPMGIACIHFINIVRVCALAVIAYKDITLLSFNHTYTFTILVYGFIFALWMWWVNKYSKT